MPSSVRWFRDALRGSGQGGVDANGQRSLSSDSRRTHARAPVVHGGSEENMRGCGRVQVGTGRARFGVRAQKRRKERRWGVISWTSQRCAFDWCLTASRERRRKQRDSQVSKNRDSHSSHTHAFTICERGERGWTARPRGHAVQKARWERVGEERHSWRAPHEPSPSSSQDRGGLPCTAAAHTEAGDRGASLLRLTEKDSFDLASLTLAVTRLSSGSAPEMMSRLTSVTR
jgi:hypothetical protein